MANNSLNEKALEVKTSILINLDFSNSTTLLCFFFLYFNH